MATTHLLTFTPKSLQDFTCGSIFPWIWYETDTALIPISKTPNFKFFSAWHKSPLKTHFCRAMRKRGLCRHAVSVCLSVTFVHSVKTNKHTFKIYSPSGSHIILVFPYETSWHYSNEDPPNGGVKCKGVWKNDDFRPISRFISEMMQDRTIVTMEGE